MKREMKNEKLALATAIYVAVAFSKRFWLGDLNGAIFWMADFFCFVLLPLMLIAWVSQVESPFKELRLHPESRVRMGYGELVFFSVICFAVFFVVAHIAGRIGDVVQRAYPEVLLPTLGYASRLPSAPVLQFAVAIYFGLSAGIVEEYFYRGAMKNILDMHWPGSGFTFVGLSAIVFGGAHWAAGLGSVVSNLFVGLAAAALYLRLKDLRPMMAGHCLFDFWLYAR